MAQQGTTIYRARGGSQTLDTDYLQEVLYKIQKDTTNKYDVYEDTKYRLYFVLIASNRFLVLDKDVSINTNILNEYSRRQHPPTPSA